MHNFRDKGLPGSLSPVAFTLLAPTHRPFNTFANGSKDGVHLVGRLGVSRANPPFRSFSDR